MDEIADRLMARAGWLRKFRSTGGHISPHEVGQLVRDLEQCADAVRLVAAGLREIAGAPDAPAPLGSGTGPARGQAAPRPVLRLVDR